MLLCLYIRCSHILQCWNWWRLWFKHCYILIAFRDLVLMYGPLLAGQANENIVDLVEVVDASHTGLTSQDRGVGVGHGMSYHNERSAVSGLYKNSCNICHESFGSSSSLWRHKRMKHSQKKLPQCPYCDKKFTDLHNLRTHEISHTNERQYVCVTCNKAYKYKQDLKNHNCRALSWGNRVLTFIMLSRSCVNFIMQRQSCVNFIMLRQSCVNFIILRQSCVNFIMQRQSCVNFIMMLSKQWIYFFFFFSWDNLHVWVWKEEWS
jgi:hypothetical protein